MGAFKEVSLIIQDQQVSEVEAVRLFHEGRRQARAARLLPFVGRLNAAELRAGGIYPVYCLASDVTGDRWALDCQLFDDRDGSRVGGIVRGDWETLAAMTELLQIVGGE